MAILNTKPMLHIVIPELFKPLQTWYNDFKFSANAPSLSTLLNQYQLNKSHNKAGINASLFALLGVVDQELPIARYRLKTSKKGGGVPSDNKESTLICADPCHFEVGINDITLTEQITNLTNDEAKLVIDTLNDHFKQDGIEFICDNDRQWYLLLPTVETLSTIPITEVLRKNIVNFLPESKARNWKVIQNETQMLLHGLALNQEREMLGEPTLNSLWFWGAGDASIKNTSISTVYGGSVENGRLLANAADCEWYSLDSQTDISSLLTGLKGDNVLVLDDLFFSTVYDQTDQYQEALSQIDSRVFEPLLKAWKQGKVDLVIDGCDGILLTPKKANKWAVWQRKSKPLLDIAKEISKGLQA